MPKELRDSRGICVIDGEVDDMPLSSNAFRVYCHMVCLSQKNSPAYLNPQKVGLICFGPDLADTTRQLDMVEAAFQELIEYNMMIRKFNGKDASGTISYDYALTDQSEWRTS